MRLSSIQYITSSVMGCVLSCGATLGEMPSSLVYNTGLAAVAGFTGEEFYETTRASYKVTGILITMGSLLYNSAKLFTNPSETCFIERGTHILVDIIVTPLVADYINASTHYQDNHNIILVDNLGEHNIQNDVL